MNKDAWAILGIIGAAILGGFGYLLSVIIGAHVSYQPLGAYGVSYAVEAGGATTPAEIKAMLAECLEVFPQVTKYGAGQTEKALNGVELFVTKAPTFLSASGDPRAGETVGKQMHIGCWRCCRFCLLRWEAECF